MSVTLLGAGVSAETSSTTRSSAFAQRVNIHRVSMQRPDVKPLAHDAALHGVAVYRVQRMINELWYGHRDPSGRYVYWDMLTAGLTFEAWGENVCWGTGEPEVAFQAFLASEGHRRNLESGEYTHQAAAFVFDPFGGVYTSTLHNPPTQNYLGPNWFICHLFREELP